MSERLVARVQNHPLDILFVRTGDVIEFVADGVADAGVTGVDILVESGADLPKLRDLGYGAAAPPQGRRRVRDPGAADREDPSVTPSVAATVRALEEPGR